MKQKLLIRDFNCFFTSHFNDFETGQAMLETFLKHFGFSFDGKKVSSFEEAMDTIVQNFKPKFHLTELIAHAHQATS